VIVLPNKVSLKSFNWELSCYMCMNVPMDMKKLRVAYCNFVNMPKLVLR
jgi:hypothetical protein